MEIYEHHFNDVEKYLHHRPPYLLVDRILSIGESEIVTEKMVRGDEFFISGHFPGAPILPGAMMQEFTTQTAGVLIAARYNPMQEFDTSDPFFNEYALGVLVKVKQARYKGFARPGDTLVATVSLQEQLSGVFDFSARVSVADRTIMRNSFQLTNIKSSVLQGK
ncbi:MAG: beta-hydroxyacyl-ACP dehydratase [Planctomycetaceae bacterium]|nr:beta-hydroxyacyl-ACP dehydratase [Planctomycetaceae bacterium]